MVVLFIGAVLAAAAIGFIAISINKKNKSGKHSVLALMMAFVFAVLFCIVPFSIHIIDTGEIAVVKFMGNAKEVKTAGMHFDFWLTNQYEIYDAKVQNVDIVTSAYSSDAQTMDIAMTLQYQISVEKGVEIAKQYGSLAALQSRIQAIAVEKTKSVLSSYKAMDIIAQRSSMSPKVEEAIKEAISEEYFVTVSTVVLTNIDFSDAFERAVEEKMIAEQNQLKAEYQNKETIAKAEAEAKAAIARAEAEAQAKVIEAEADRDAQVELARAEALAIQLKSVEIARMLGFDIVEKEGVDEEGNPTIEYQIDFSGKSADEIALITDYLEYMEYLAKWDGKLPTVVTDSGANIVIPVDPSKQ